MKILTSWMQKGFEQGREEGFKLGWEEGFKLGWKEGFKLGIEESKKLGRQQEVALIVRRQLQHLFGDLSQSQQERIQSLSRERLRELGETLLDFTSITDLDNWLAWV